MAKHVLYNAVVVFNGVTLTDHVRKVSYSVSTNDGPAAAMGELQDYDIPSTILVSPITIEYYQDFAATNVYITHKALWVVGATAVLTVKADSASDSATNPNFTATVFVKDMKLIDGARGDVHLNSITYKAAGALTFDVT